MKSWPVQDAKARFSELLETCIAEGPQMVTKRGAEAAVLVSIEEWKRAKTGSGRSFKELMLADDARFDFEIPRMQFGFREPPAFDD